MRFNLRQMEVFRAIMITGSMSGAARMLYISQPAVSKLLAHTETTLKLKLFHRVRGKLAPTAEAHSLFEEVNQVYEAAIKVDQFADNLARQPSGRLSLCSSPSLGLTLIPKLLRLFLDEYPGTMIHLHTTLIQDVSQELLSGKADVAITVLPIENPNLHIKPLIRGRMVCALPQGHALTGRSRVRLNDLVGERLILYSPTIPFGRLLRSAFDRHGCDVSASIDVPRAELACSLTRQGLGITIVDQFSVADGIWNGITIRPLEEEIPILVSLSRSRYGVLSAEVEHFLDILKREFD